MNDQPSSSPLVPSLCADTVDLIHAKQLVDQFDEPQGAAPVKALLMKLAQAHNHAGLTKVMQLRPTWPDDVIGRVYHAATHLPAPPISEATREAIRARSGGILQIQVMDGVISPSAELLRIVLPHLHRLPEHADVWNKHRVQHVFFEKDTPPEDHHWMVGSFIPSINPQTPWGREILTSVWYSAAAQETRPHPHPHNLSQLPEDTLRGWVHGYVQQCPDQARLPNAAEHAALRSTDPNQSGLPPSSAMVHVFRNILNRTCHQMPDRYLAVLNALASEPTLLAWVAHTLARSYVINSSGADAYPLNELGYRPNTPLVDVLERLPAEWASSVAQWVCQTLSDIPPEITAMGDKAVLTKTIQPATLAPNRPLKM